MNFPITPYKIKKGFLYWKHFGTKEFLIRLADRMEPEEVPYGPWYEKHKASEKELERQRSHPIEGGPKFSVLVPAYHTPKKYLCEMIDSVLAQTYPDLELIIADAGASEGEDAVKEVTEEYAASDSRVRYIPLPENAGIAANTNAAAEEARGSFLAFLDHDDLIAPDALYEAAIRITSEGADMIYTDEDKIRSDGKSHFQPHLKPEFNIDLLRSNNYITHFLIVKKSLAEEAGLFDASMSGAQDYDFIFRCAEKAERIVRIPRILYHWRTHEASTADNPMSKQYAYEAGRRAIEGNLRRCGVQGTVEPLPDFGFYRVRYPADTSAMISVIIPNKDEAEALRKCVDSVLQTGYENLEIIIVENNSTSREIFDLYGELKEHPKIRLVRWKGKGFNYSAINNYGAKFARGEYLLFLNNDVYGTLGTEWLTEMLGVVQRTDVAAVGARLYYPDMKIQSAGIVIGIGGVAGSVFTDLKKGHSGYMHKAALMQDLSAVTAACMMTKKELFIQAGGFEEKLAVAFNDVDLCLRLGEMGFRIVYDPYAELIHDESRSRGAEDTKEKTRRFQNEIEYMRTEYETLLKEGDPCYNPNLSLKKWNYSLKA